MDRRFEEVSSRVLTVQEVSRYLKVHPSTIYRMLKRNELPAFRVGSDWRFTVEAIDQWRAKVEAGESSSPSRELRGESQGLSK